MNCWLIERPVKDRAHPEYWSASRRKWTSDPRRATRYQSQGEAEITLANLPYPTALAVSHGFMNNDTDDDGA